MIKVFFDTEFTGLHKGTSLMSIGLVAGKETFYAELTDYDPSQVNDWLRENVIANFTLSQVEQNVGQVSENAAGGTAVEIRGNKKQVARRLKTWLLQFGPVQMWSDCLAYDWVLFNDLLADYTNGYPQLPEGVHYIPMDICTLFQIKGIDPDISREEFAQVAPGYFAKHNALGDAWIIADCYEKLAA